MAPNANPKPMPRISLPAIVRFWGPGISGAGMLENVSMTGALIWPATTIPARSTDLRLELVTGGGLRVRAGATVIRRDGAGFAVGLRSLEPPVDRLLQAIIRLGSADSPRVARAREGDGGGDRSAG